MGTLRQQLLQSSKTMAQTKVTHAQVARSKCFRRHQRMDLATRKARTTAEVSSGTYKGSTTSASGSYKNSTEACTRWARRGHKAEALSQQQPIRRHGKTFKGGGGGGGGAGGGGEEGEGGAAAVSKKPAGREGFSKETVTLQQLGSCCWMR